MPVGDEGGTRPGQLADAINPWTAAVLVPAHLDGANRTVVLSEVCEIAHAQGVPVVVDAAYLNFPPARMGTFTKQGADLVCFSAKYFWGPNAAGFVCGQAELVEAVVGIDFTGYESGRYRTFGRPLKMDRHTIVATFLALEQWFAMDHTARLATHVRQVKALDHELGTVQGITARPLCFTMEETFVPDPVNCLHLTFEPDAKWTAADIAGRLAGGNPSIAVVIDGNALAIVMETVREGDELLIGERLREAFAAQATHASR